MLFLQLTCWRNLLWINQIKLEKEKIQRKILWYKPVTTWRTDTRRENTKNQSTILLPKFVQDIRIKKKRNLSLFFSTFSFKWRKSPNHIFLSCTIRGKRNKKHHKLNWIEWKMKQENRNLFLLKKVEPDEEWRGCDFLTRTPTVNQLSENFISTSFLSAPSFIFFKIQWEWNGKIETKERERRKKKLAESKWQFWSIFPIFKNFLPFKNSSTVFSAKIRSLKTISVFFSLLLISSIFGSVFYQRKRERERRRRDEKERKIIHTTNNFWKKKKPKLMAVE